MDITKVAVVTGAGRGIGAATAALFAGKGYAVCINYKSNHSAAESLAQSIRAKGGKCITVQADVAPEPVQAHPMSAIVLTHIAILYYRTVNYWSLW